MSYANGFHQRSTPLVGPLDGFVYTQHGHELMGCKSPVGEPQSMIDKYIGFPHGGLTPFNSFI
jgi:hypothetical protein